jgi:hypothetical protein
VQRKIIRRERRDVTGDWIKLQNMEFYNFYSSSYVIQMIKSRRMRWAGHAERSREKRNAPSLVGKHEGRRPFGRHTRRWKDNIKIYLQGIV